MNFEIYAGLIYIISCVINHSSVAAEKVAGFADEELYHLAKKHSVSALVGYGMIPVCSERNDDSIAWNKIVAKSQRKTILMDAERDAIFRFFEEKGIWYVPLKGIVLEKLYPSLGLREMCDNDILYDGEYKEILRNYMVDRGYTVTSYDDLKDDTYVKEPLYNFEFHRNLFQTSNPLFSYFEHMKTRLIKDSDNEFGYHFSNEDFYIYLLAHAYKHFYYGGTGFRSLLDVYIFLHTQHLDWNYIDCELKKTDLTEFNRILTSVSDRLFSCTELPDIGHYSDEEKEFLSYIIGSGTYGNKENKVKNRLLLYTNGKVTIVTLLKYCFYRIFPDKEWMHSRKPEIYGSRLKRISYYSQRAAKAVFRLPKALREIKLVKKQKGKFIGKKW